MHPGGDILELGNKIRDLTLADIRIHPLPVSDKTTWLFLEVALRDGTRGFGEATAFGDEDGVVSEQRAFSGELASGELFPIGNVLARLRQVQSSPARRAFTHGLEQALYDAVARSAGLPLALLLGDPIAGTFHATPISIAELSTVGRMDLAPRRPPSRPATAIRRSRSHPSTGCAGRKAREASRRRHSRRGWPA